EQLYSSGNHHLALGASFGLENMAITMWDHLIPGLTRLRARRFPNMDITYFTFHRELESQHEDAMKNAVAAMEGAKGAAKGADSEKDGGTDRATGRLTDAERQDFRRGCQAVLDSLEGFWMGLERTRVARARMTMKASKSGACS
ncbi:MAG: iron-containing redox enzyme family protein, partial [Nitrospirales bacterium]